MFGVDLYVNNMYVKAQRERWATRCFQETLALFFQVPCVKTPTHLCIFIPSPNYYSSLAVLFQVPAVVGGLQEGQSADLLCRPSFISEGGGGGGVT